MSYILSEDYKHNMIVVYVNPRTNYFKSYNLGTKAVIAEKRLTSRFKYGYPLLSYLATAYTVYTCQNNDINDKIFTSSIAAQWLYNKCCESRMLVDIELKRNVSQLGTAIFSKKMPEIKIWNEEKWGKVTSNIDAAKFEICSNEILSYLPYGYYKKKKRKPKQNHPDAFNWED